MGVVTRCLPWGRVKALWSARGAMSSTARVLAGSGRERHPEPAAGRSSSRSRAAPPRSSRLDLPRRGPSGPGRGPRPRHRGRPRRRDAGRSRPRRHRRPRRGRLGTRAGHAPGRRPRRRPRRRRRRRGACRLRGRGGRVAVLLADQPALRPDDLRAALARRGRTPALRAVPDAEGAGTVLLDAADRADRCAPRSGRAAPPRTSGWPPPARPRPAAAAPRRRRRGAPRRGRALGVGPHSRAALAHARLPGMQAHRAPLRARRLRLGPARRRHRGARARRARPVASGLRHLRVGPAGQHRARRRRPGRDAGVGRRHRPGEASSDSTRPSGPSPGPWSKVRIGHRQLSS